MLDSFRIKQLNRKHCSRSDHWEKQSAKITNAVKKESTGSPELPPANQRKEPPAREESISYKFTDSKTNHSDRTDSGHHRKPPNY